MANDYNNKKYYWIKLRDTFMTSDAVDFLMAQKDGANYVVLYQMLCLKTINTGGELSRTIGEVIIPYDIDKIVRDVKWFSKDTVIVALDLYKKLGLIFKNENDVLTITNYEKMVGSETQSAIYKQDKKELENFQLNSNRYKDIKILDIKILDIKSIDNKIIDKENNKENDVVEVVIEPKIYSYIENNLGITLSGTNYQKIEELLSVYNDEMLCYGIDKTIASGKRTLNYFFGIIENWKQEKFKTLEEVKNNEIKPKNKKSINPEWLNKKIESTTDETENKEFNKFIEEFRKE